MIDVRLFAVLPMRSATGRKQFQVEARPGLSVREVVRGEGLREEDVFLIMINGLQAQLDSTLQDGDVLSLFPPVGGG